MKEIKAFQCDYCNKYYKHKSSAKRHENICFKNPANKACLTCGNFITDYEADYDERYNYCYHSGKSFTNEVTNKWQEFQHDCNHWIPIAEDIDEVEDIREENISG